MTYHRKNKPNTLILILYILFHATPGHADEGCSTSVDNLYLQFKQYRELLNESPHLESLSNFFSGNFNQYFSDKMRSASSEAVRQRYLGQYWDNLNAARDVVIVFDYNLECGDRHTTLNLVSVLDNTPAREGQQIRLWQVAIKYVKNIKDWKIESISYEELKHNKGKNYQANEIINNFLSIH